MIGGKIKSWLTAILLVAAVVVIIWQRQEINRLAGENETLRAKAGDSTPLRQEMARLSTELDLVQKRVASQVQELARLRSKATALGQTEQENIKLKTERDRLVQGLSTPAPAPSLVPESDEIRERKQTMARMLFGKNVAMSLIIFADGHDGNLPEDPSSALASLASSPEFAESGFNAEQYNFPLRGSIYQVKEPARTLLAMDKKPTPLRDGQFAKTYIFADGHVELVKKNTPEEFAAWEEEHTPTKVQP